MGFRLNRTYVLDFDGTALAGLVVKLRSTPVSAALDVAAADTDAALAGLLAEYVTEWNYEDPDGAPVPLTVEGILSNLERPVLQRICKEWYKAAVGVTAPLDGPSTSTAPSVELSMPMAVA